PDVLTTDWGDGYLIPHLLDWARRARRSLRLNRDGDFNVEARLGKSFMSYGRTVYQSGAHYLFGRWHLDLKNSFYFKECGWEGLFEISRIAKIPVQRAARTTIGTSLSSMQLDVALKRGLLIPLDKAQAEDFRPASDLLVADKGGLVYEPDIGWFEHIAEYDFVSMYPTLMVQHNISPETINCACCDGAVGGDEMVGARQRGNHDGGAVGGDEMVGARQRGNHDGGAVGGDEMVGARQRGNHRGFSVPEIGHHLCLRRRGLVPDVLAPLLKKRSEYKRLYKSNAPDAARYKARADAHKWCLVTCVDGKTRLPYREGGEIKVGSIRDLIDRHAQDTEGTVPLTESVEVVGLDQKGRASFCSVKQFVRKPAPSALLRIGVGGGRKINYTAEHDCLILKGGHLVKRKADQLRVGDWVPVLARLPSPENPPCHVDVFRILLERLPLNELPLWRVFGNSLGRVISDNGDAIEKNIKGDYSPLSLRNWRSGNYLPFHLVSCLSKGFWAATHVGRGKRSGGLVQKIPARLELNEGLGFFLGFYVGDGSVSGRMIRLDVGTAEKDIADFLVAFVRHQFCLNVHRYKEKGVAMEVIQINSIALIRILEVVFGLGRASDSGKLVVPSLVLNGPREFRRGFLRGLLGADGHVARARNFVGWSSMGSELIEDLGFLLGMEGLQFRFSDPVPALSRVDVRGATDVRELMSGGILSRKHAATMRGQPKRTAERRAEFPPHASGLLRLARKARVARVAPRLTNVERISLHSARVKIEQIRRRLDRLSPQDAVELARVSKLINSDLVYERVKSIQKVLPTGPYVYCVTMNQDPRVFCLQGGVLTGNCFGYL
ncbi:MAG: hypothetical protein KBD85_06455, partial [Elusimicrobia bacterium]|nr:hypothetical protein [Elusimicrobiota bacterium]